MTDVCFHLQAWHPIFPDRTRTRVMSSLSAAGRRLTTPPLAAPTATSTLPAPGIVDQYGYSSQTSVLHREAADQAFIRLKQEEARKRQERLFDPKLNGLAVSVAAAPHTFSTLLCVSPAVFASHAARA